MDTEKLIDAVTKAIMLRLENETGATTAADAICDIVAFGNVPAGLFSGECAVRQGRSPQDVEGSQYIALTAEAFQAFHGGPVTSGASLPAAPATSAPCCGAGGASVDLTSKRLINEADLSGCARPGDTVRIGPRAIVTALADDYAKSNKIQFVRG
jgi:hypothetical protein